LDLCLDLACPLCRLYSSSVLEQHVHVLRLNLEVGDLRLQRLDVGDERLLLGVRGVELKCKLGSRFVLLGLDS
jgi:hypothetical protein